MINLGKQVKFGFGAGVDPKHLQRFEQRFGFPLVEGWAMTETGTHVCITANKEPRHIGTRCIGRAPEAIEYRLVDEQGEDVGPGEPGELLIRARGSTRARVSFPVTIKTRRKRPGYGKGDISIPAMLCVSVKTVPFILSIAVKTSSGAVVKTSLLWKWKTSCSSIR